MFPKFGVDSSSRFPFRARTHTLRLTVNDATDQFTLATHRLLPAWVNMSAGCVWNRWSLARGTVCWTRRRDVASTCTLLTYRTTRVSRYRVMDRRRRLLRTLTDVHIDCCTAATISRHPTSTSRPSIHHCIPPFLSRYASYQILVEVIDDA